MATIKLLYFKPSGKWAYEGEFEYQDNLSMHGLHDLISQYNAERILPGLDSGSWDGPIYIDSSEHPLGFPQLII